MFPSEILDGTKLLLGINTEDKDEILSFIIDDTVSCVKAYCRIDGLPCALYGLCAQLAAKSYRESGYGSEEIPKEVQSVSEGDRSVTFKAVSDTTGIVANFKGRLRPFINRKGRTPSDLDGGGKEN
mgnify:FL=1